MTRLRKSRDRPITELATETTSITAQPKPFLDPEQIITVKVSKPKPRKTTKKTKTKAKAHKKAKKKAKK